MREVGEAFTLFPRLQVGGLRRQERGWLRAGERKHPQGWRLHPRTRLQQNDVSRKRRRLQNAQPHDLEELNINQETERSMNTRERSRVHCAAPVESALSGPLGDLTLLLERRFVPTWSEIGGGKNGFSRWHVQWVWQHRDQEVWMLIVKVATNDRWAGTGIGQKQRQVDQLYRRHWAYCVDQFCRKIRSLFTWYDFPRPNTMLVMWMQLNAGIGPLRRLRTLSMAIQGPWDSWEPRRPPHCGSSVSLHDACSPVLPEPWPNLPGSQCSSQFPRRCQETVSRDPLLLPQGPGPRYPTAL